MRIAVVGGGIAGLAAAHALRGRAEFTLFEAAPRFGGHANTVDVTLDGVTHGVDTGFLVFNERTYPGLVRLFAQLGVATAASDMSFSVQVPGALGGNRPLEWSGSNLDTVFCQRGNLMRPRFLRMLRDLLRFNRLCTLLAQAGAELPLRESLADFLARERFGPEFRDWYLLPMAACIWSCPSAQMLRFPIGTLIRFCHNHGLLQVTGRPQWYTVRGGSRHYVDAIVAGLPDARAATPVRRIWRGPQGVTVATDAGSEQFDRVVLAVHSDQALAMLADPDSAEAGVLSAIGYQRNRAVLHTDAAMLPANRRAWAAWNYEGAPPGRRALVCLHYLVNRLQPLPWQQPVIVSLNPVRPIAPQHVLAEFDYAHPVFDAAALQAQTQLQDLQGRRHTWFCGAWTGYGFHEDGLASGQAAARQLLARGSIEQASAEAFA
ncbi:MAG: FAD-dependent oxidoreductase [Pseudomonadota bacterium]